MIDQGPAAPVSPYFGAFRTIRNDKGELLEVVPLKDHPPLSTNGWLLSVRLSIDALLGRDRR